ncbi:DinB superfamily protein [Corynebacterium ciconiae DSM 44920]|uniref:DinB family protein n=1 Tax=Corynebacterium ciconiae TaxID=227319 RepID=UPI00037A611A|nr:DinB family protein [Corynebacterium ciconiae]WKD60103.1 DinB superfamily protein [Corynebacterium ciconiae DSM 44920]
MTRDEILIEFISRAHDSLDSLGEVDAATASRAPGGHPNSLAWLLWHTGRMLDIQLSELSGQPQLWHSLELPQQLGLGELGEGMGYGHSDQEARAIQLRSAEDVRGLISYVHTVLDDVQCYALSGVDFDEVIDTSFTPPVTRGVRIVSLIDDAIQHLAQAHYAARIVR